MVDTCGMTQGDVLLGFKRTWPTVSMIPYSGALCCQHNFSFQSCNYFMNAHFFGYATG